MPFDPVSAALEIGGKLIDRLIPNPEAKAAAQMKLMEMAQAGELAHLAADTELAKAQIEVNKADAASPHLFVAGWRPAVGWICAAGLGYEFVARPFLVYLPSLFGLKVDAPELGMGDLMGLLTGLLGLSVTRTAEKFRGVATSVGGLVLPPLERGQAAQTPVVAAAAAHAALSAPADPVAGRKGWFG